MVSSGATRSIVPILMKPSPFALIALSVGIVFQAAHQSRAAEADSASQNAITESPQQLDARMGWWREARFGMFIHWGLYSVAAGEWDGKPTQGAGEWIMNDMKIPVSQYAKLVPRFNPVKFDAHQWVKIAKDAGMKYIVITTKHHDGFALYPSALADWCMKSTPFHRDPLKELAEACRGEGIKLGFYHSIMDWHHPNYDPRKPWNDLPDCAPDFDRYVPFLKGELKELLTDYGNVAVLWFDGQWEKTWTYDRGADLFNYVRGLQPQIIVNNRVGSEQPLKPGQHPLGDYKTPEQTIPPNGLGVDWETCMTMNDTWGYKKSDHDWKSTQTLVRNLIDCASKGGNYLLNVGPTGEGLIPEASVQRLEEIGRWMKINGEAIYGTTASPFRRPLPWGRCTTKRGQSVTTLYLHVFDRPSSGELELPGLQNKPKAAWRLQDSSQKPLKFERSKNGVTIKLPPNPSDRISTTLVLQIDGQPEVESVPLAQKSNGSIDLPASEATLHGSTLQYESGGGRDNIGFWTNPQDWVDWEFTISHPGKFEVSASVAALGSGSFEISVAGQKLRGVAPVTGDYTKFTTLKLGTIILPAAGKTTVTVKPIGDGWQPLNLKSIHFEPAAK